MKKIKFKLSTEKVSALIFFVFAILFPMYSTLYQVDNFSNFYITVLVSFSIVLIWGFTGIFSFGQAAFYGMGAYTYAILSKVMGGGNSTFPALLGSVVTAALFAGILGFFIFYGRISNVFTGIITMSVATVCKIFMNQTSEGQWKLLGIPIGGFNGINKIPSLEIGGISISQLHFYFFVVAVLLIIYLAMKKVEKSNFGYALFGIRENKERSEMFGYDTAKIQTLIFAISGGLAGLAGGLFAGWSGYVVPTNFSVNSSTIAVIMVAVAGRKNVIGAMIMTVIYAWFTQYLATTGSEYTQLILGVLLIISVLYIPDGIMIGFFNKVDGLFKRKHMNAE